MCFAQCMVDLAQAPSNPEEDQEGKERGWMDDGQTYYAKIKVRNKTFQLQVRRKVLHKVWLCH